MRPFIPYANAGDSKWTDQTSGQYAGLRTVMMLALAQLHNFQTAFTRRLRLTLRLLSRLRLRDVISTPLILVLVWAWILHWGERADLTAKIRSCDWSTWESWKSTYPDAKPYRLVLIADPQLVDAHTYPGRPWPLSWLTIQFTDQYMRRSFWRMQETLDPDGVIFLGDMFDGGREWNLGWNAHTRADDDLKREERWKRYHHEYWMQEYRRFGKIFWHQWQRYGLQRRPTQNQRLFHAGLPGNHDLGLGNGIRLGVRDRFISYFGDGNRVDIIGNHSFVALDSVSLSAKSQPGVTETLQTGSREVYGPAEEFLHHVPAIRSRAIRRLLRLGKGDSPREQFEDTVLDIDDPKLKSLSVDKTYTADIPNILLTHIPFYRDSGTPCGPLRERYPPSVSNSGSPVDGDANLPIKDDRNAITISRGEQYQNVLTADISTEIVNLVPGITHIFSGDDHDYCEIEHSEFTSSTAATMQQDGHPESSPGNANAESALSKEQESGTAKKHEGRSSSSTKILEVTVKSFSWAMGIRKPGFLLVSLYNPIDAEGRSLRPQGTAPQTLQKHLCLLPDQLGIFMRYGILLGVTILVLLIRAARLTRWGHDEIIGLDISGVDRYGDEHHSLLPITLSQNTQSQNDSQYTQLENIASVSSRSEAGPRRGLISRSGTISSTTSPYQPELAHINLDTISNQSQDYVYKPPETTSPFSPTVIKLQQSSRTSIFEYLLIASISNRSRFLIRRRRLSGRRAGRVILQEGLRGFLLLGVLAGGYYTCLITRF